MIKVIKHFSSQDVEKDILKVAEKALSDSKKLLLSVPDNIEIYFDNFCLLKEHGVGGFAYSNKIITIAYDEKFPDKIAQSEYLYQTFLHELYHLSHGYFSVDFECTPLEEAIYEGAATLFEKEHAESEAPYSEYDPSLVEEQLANVKLLNEDYDLKKWKIYDKESGQRWILYKVGTFIVERAIKNSGKSIIELNSLNAQEILKLSSL